MSLRIPSGSAHMGICPQTSLWESSFVTKQSHLDSSGKRRSHMLSHRLRVTKSPSGSAGHVGHMSACGCLGFSAPYTYANAHCTHTHKPVLQTHTTIRIAHLLNVTHTQRRAAIRRFGVRFQSGLSPPRDPSLQDEARGQSTRPIMGSANFVL